MHKLKPKILAFISSTLAAILLGGIFLIVVPEQSFGLTAEEKQPPAKQTRTLKYHVFQEPAVIVTPGSTTKQFTIFVGEKDPVIKSAYIEVRGVTKATASQTITVDINQTNSFPTTRSQAFNFDVSGNSSHFRFLYNGSATETLLSYLSGIITSAGSRSFYLKVDVSGADVSALQARLVLTYQFTPPTEGALPVSGELTSSVFDTAVTDGAAYHSINWKGQLGGGGQNEGKVRFQLATSNAAGGPWTYIGGATCGAGDWYDATNSSKAVETSCSGHNNARYYRYKIQICSNDCSTAGANTPTVTDVNVSWAP